MPTVTNEPGGLAIDAQPGAVLHLNLGDEPPTLDPSLVMDPISRHCTYLMFMGLTKPGVETGQPEPWLASKWEVSPDGLTWTFQLRGDAFWVRYDPATKKAEKKRPVVAHDVVRSVQRSINAATASPQAYVNSGSRNVQAVHEYRQRTWDDFGVGALDEHTVQFSLQQPSVAFAATAGLTLNYPLPWEPLEAFGDEWSEPGNIWTCGPYMLDTWEHRRRLVMRKNPYWFGADHVQVEQIMWAMVNGAEAMAMYDRGALDVVAPPQAELERIQPGRH